MIDSSSLSRPQIHSQFAKTTSFLLVASGKARAVSGVIHMRVGAFPSDHVAVLPPRTELPPGCIKGVAPHRFIAVDSGAHDPLLPSNHEQPWISAGLLAGKQLISW